MRKPLDWLKSVLDRGRTGLTLFTPQVAQERNPLLRAAVAGGTAVAIVWAGAIAMVAFAALMFAIGAIYFLATQVLGLKVNVDPQAFYQSVQRQASAYGAN